MGNPETWRSRVNAPSSIRGLGYSAVAIAALIGCEGCSGKPNPEQQGRRAAERLYDRLAEEDPAFREEVNREEFIDEVAKDTTEKIKNGLVPRPKTDVEILKEIEIARADLEESERMFKRTHTESMKIYRDLTRERLDLLLKELKKVESERKKEWLKS